MSSGEERIRIRTPRTDDATALTGLIHSLAGYFLADPERPQDAEAFFKTVSVEAHAARFLDDRYLYLLAVSGEQVVGMVALYENSHLYQLFVRADVQGRGLGRRLWETVRDWALEHGNPGVFTVNSSPYAVPVYRRFGFRETGVQEHRDGVAWVPMRLEAPAGE